MGRPRSDKVHVHVSISPSALRDTDEMCQAYGLTRSSLWELLIRRAMVDDDILRRWKQQGKRPR